MDDLQTVENDLEHATAVDPSPFPGAKDRWCRNRANGVRGGVFCSLGNPGIRARTRVHKEHWMSRFFSARPPWKAHACHPAVMAWVEVMEGMADRVERLGLLYIFSSAGMPYAPDNKTGIIAAGGTIIPRA